jgi:hypothetical protein
MASNYNTIRAENERKYGTDIGRIGPMLLAHRYADRTHFIFELLQNAEDALARRRRGWRGSKAVTFVLDRDMLRVSHYGEPFSEGDVRGICGIAESTKEDFTAIGRFGIGFKSVYAFTKRPEIHSGAEDFAIENFVWPVTSPPLRRETDETIFLVPLDKTDTAAHQEIAAGLERLGTSTLLFLHHIEEINWTIRGGRSGVYLRDAKKINTEVQQLEIVGQEHGTTVTSSRWLVFARQVTHRGRDAGNVEIAFSVSQDVGSRQKRIQHVGRSPLVVFFPTVLETHLGFLVQGPYRTTPSRDNVPPGDKWNQHLVSETASLLVSALGWLRDHNFLTVAALRCLPLEGAKFGGGSMFAPLFEATKKALVSEPLLPRFDRGHIAAKFARLARTQELRDLVSSAQLALLFGKRHELVWLSGEITQDRTPDLHRYLIDELEVDQLTPETIIPKFTGTFLKSQSDSWIVAFYEFLNGLPALRWRVSSIPLVRLEDGSQVLAEHNGRPQAFLPGAMKTGFPTVRSSVCATKGAREFLRSLGLTEPDPVDDVIHNLLPKYRRNTVRVSMQDYRVDIERILAAFATDSKTRREALLAALRETTFVMAVDAGDGSKWRSKPDAVYLATERLKQLFSGVKKVFLVDDRYECLRGEDTRELLEACGATRYLQPVAMKTALSWEEKNEIRRNAGLGKSSWETLNDVTLRGIDALLELLPSLDAAAQRRKSTLLWEALSDLENRRGSRPFLVEYRWGYAQISKIAFFDATFIRQLNETEWVLNQNDSLETPEFVLFETLGWQVNPFLQSKVRFKPPVIETLAREAGIEPGVLDLLKRYGLTSEAEFRAKLGFTDDGATERSSEDTNVDSAEQEDATDSDTSAAFQHSNTSGGNSAATSSGATNSSQSRSGTGGSGQNQGAGAGASSSPSTRQGSGEPRRAFVSYVAVGPKDEETDPDGLGHAARMELEAKAIDLILLQEPCWERTPTHNPGFDLYEPNGNGVAIRWCEVKAMSASLEEHPVGLSRTQFEQAREHGENYWLYVVEHSGTERARILRIQDPVGKARTFTFDHGWSAVADIHESVFSDKE